MDEKTVDDYKRELLEMHRQSTSDLSGPLPQYPNDDGIGRGVLIVTVTTGRGTRPIVNAQAAVSNPGESEPFVILRTDESGKTRPERLPAPRKNLSETPNENGDKVYAQYNITVTADGYVSAAQEGVPIFDGVVSVQPFDLIWLPAAGSKTETVTGNETDTYEL